MVQSQAETVEAYLEELPPERREVVSQMRELILENLPNGYRETMSWGMISYEVPLETYPNTYNGKPLGYIGLAAQKRHYALYLMAVYQNPEQLKALEAAFEAAGKRMDMGKSCLRFRRVEDVPLETIAGLVASTTPEQFIAMYEQSRKK
jgi:uncharacterized protein YdhG (YjbR/CyaY superfamily)